MCLCYSEKDICYNRCCDSSLCIAVVNEKMKLLCFARSFIPFRPLLLKKNQSQSKRSSSIQKQGFFEEEGGKNSLQNISQKIFTWWGKEQEGRRRTRGLHQQFSVPALLIWENHFRSLWFWASCHDHQLRKELFNLHAILWDFHSAQHQVPLVRADFLLLFAIREGVQTKKRF